MRVHVQSIHGEGPEPGGKPQCFRATPFGSRFRLIRTSRTTEQAMVKGVTHEQEAFVTKGPWGQLRVSRSTNRTVAVLSIGHN